MKSNDEIREILARRIDQQKQGVGIVAGVVEPNGRRLVTHGSLANGSSCPVDGDTIFEVGSVSKVFTSLLLAEMVIRNEVALDDPAARYLPEHVRMPEKNGRSITLLDLATHYSGLPPLPGNLKLDSDAAFSVDDLYEFLSGYTLPCEPGSEYEYSNLGAGLLGHLLAHRAGTDYESLLRSRITEPLGMPDTGITFSPGKEGRMATGHTAMLSSVAGSVLPTPLAGAGALRSSVNDLLTFVEAFLGYRESALAPAMKAMLEVRRPAGQATIGLGWLVLCVGDRKIAGHNGRTRGFCSTVGCDLNARIGVVVLSNASTSGGVDDIGFHLLNPQAPLANPDPPGPRVAIHINSEVFDRHVGRYQLKPNLIFEIAREGDRFFAQGFVQLPQSRDGELTALPRFELFAESEKKFFASVSDSQISFETGADGRATGLTLYRTDREPVTGERLV